jgi:hypothetical protein
MFSVHLLERENDRPGRLLGKVHAFRNNGEMVARRGPYLSKTRHVLHVIGLRPYTLESILRLQEQIEATTRRTWLRMAAKHLAKSLIIWAATCGVVVLTTHHGNLENGAPKGIAFWYVCVFVPALCSIALLLVSLLRAKFPAPEWREVPLSCYDGLVPSDVAETIGELESRIPDARFFVFAFRNRSEGSSAHDEFALLRVCGDTSFWIEAWISEPFVQKTASAP